MGGESEMISKEMVGKDGNGTDDWFCYKSARRMYLIQYLIEKCTWSGTTS